MYIQILVYCMYVMLWLFEYYVVYFMTYIKAFFHASNKNSVFIYLFRVLSSYIQTVELLRTCKNLCMCFGMV